MEHIAILEKYGHCEEDIFSLTQHIENLFPQITVLQKGLGILNNKLVSLETKEQELKKSQNEYIKAFSIETQRSNVLHKKSSQIKGQQEYNKNKEQKAISQKFIEFYRTGTDEIGLLIKAIVEKKEEISAIYKENENKIAVQQEDKKIQSEKLNKKLEIHLKEKKELEKSIDSEILGEVIYLQKKNVVPSIILIEKNYCNGCSMFFPSQTYQLAIVNGYSKCTNCKRLLIPIIKKKS